MNAGSIPNRLAGVATVLAAIVSAAGLLVTDLYRDAPNWVQQARGTDLATLFVAVPLLVFGLGAVRHRSPVGPLAIVAGLLYLAYNYAIFTFSVVMNPLTAVHIAILGLALWGLILGAQGAGVEAAAEAVSERLFKRASGAFLVAVGLLFALLWAGQIAATTMTGALAPDLVLAGLSTNPVYALDLAFFLPLCAVAGIGLIRGGRASVYALPMLIWVPLMGAGILGGFVFMASAGDAVPAAVAVLIAGLVLISAALVVVPFVRGTTGALDPTPA